MAQNRGNSTGFSKERIFELRCIASNKTQHHAHAIEQISCALAEMDAALQQSLDDRSIDSDQIAVNAARRLSQILAGDAN